MTDVEFDSDGYPTEKTLKSISDWDNQDPHGCLDFSIEAFEGGRSCGCVHDFIERGERTVIFVTGGWSGCEEVINAMAGLFRMMYWMYSARGGVHTYKVPIKKERKGND